MKKTIFKVGDRVFDIRYGWGIVIEDNIYPVTALFNLKNGNKIIKRYTPDGRSTLDDNNPMLSFTEYSLQNFSQERPINYKDYIGKWGKFWNGENNEDDYCIAKLVEYNSDANFGEQFTCIMGLNHEFFKPLTEEQVKSLNL